MLRIILFFILYALQTFESYPSFSNEELIIKDVHVDVTATSATEARSTAMVDAQRHAYKILLGEVLHQEDLLLTEPTNEQLNQLVQAIEVQNEKNSNVRYLGTLTIRFNPKAVHEWLKQNNKKAILSPTNKATVIIPLMIRGDKALLWEEDNPWAHLWNQKADLGNDDFILPMGDLQDMQNITAKDALEGNIASIRKLLSRYNAGRVIIATFYEGPYSRLEIRYFSTEGLIDNLSPYEFDAINNAPALLLISAMNKVLETSKNNTKNQTLPSSYTLDFSIPFHGYAEWLKIQQHLETLQGVKQVSIHRISQDQAQVSLLCFGPEPYIESQLKTKGLVINQGELTVSKTLSLAPQESRSK